jgi:hypothetical protein
MSIILKSKVLKELKLFLIINILFKYPQLLLNKLNKSLLILKIKSEKSKLNLLIQEIFNLYEINNTHFIKTKTTKIPKKKY